ncbi:MAG TPA: glycine/sarcosine/betaine reductase selenoprotein B family protein [Desulfobacteria bacterium]|nr:glycine/sarcosine/betaine reductase selenoprotein B family protein [Desulfobacteria bacterium]
MARLDRMTDGEKKYLLSLPCPTFGATPWAVPPSLNKCRISIVSSAGIHRRGDRPFEPGASDYRIIPGSAEPNDIVMSHVSTNFDRTGFQQDLNVTFPLERLKELAEKGIIGSVANYHYAFMGATEPQKMERAARSLAGIMKNDGVDAILLVPV